jgi:hypothetical protein
MHLDSSGTDVACVTRTGPSSYDGDGDGFLEDWSNTGSIQYAGEIMNFMIHLSTAGLIDQQIERAILAGGVGCHHDHIMGTSYPADPLGAGLIAVQNNGKYHFILGGMGEMHHQSISGPGNFATGIAGNYFTARIASQIDEKLDDGKPLRGNIFVITHYNNVENGSEQNYGILVKDANDSDINCVYNADYNKGYTENACTIAVNIGRL